MVQYNSIKEVFLVNGGLVKTSDIISNGFHNRQLDTLMSEGKINRVKRGYYQWVEDGKMEEIALLVRLFPDAVIYMESALYYHGYTDRVPDYWHIAVDKDVNKSRFRLKYPLVKPYYLEPKYLFIGKITGTFNSVTIQVYDRERTVIDIIRYAGKLDREIVNKTILNYIKDVGKDISTLMEYARYFKTEKKVQQWIGMWL